MIEAESADLARVARVRHMLDVARVAIGCGLVAITGVVVCGWVFEVRALARPLGGAQTMKMNTALSVGAFGVVLLLGDRLAALRRTLLVVAALVAVAVLVQFAFDVDLGIDELLVDDPWATGGRGRMALMTAVCVVLLSIGALVVPARDRPAAGRSSMRRIVAVGAVSAAGFISLAAIVGYLYGAGELYQPAGHVPIAIATAVCLVAATLGLATQVVDDGGLTLITGDRPGSYLARRAAPVLVAGLLLAGWVVARMYAAGWVEVEFALSLIGGAGGLLVVIGLGVSAMGLERTDRIRRETDQRLAMTTASLAMAEERAELADRLRHTQRLEVVGRVAAGVAHDFNNLLTSILGASGLLRRELPEGVGVEDLEIIDRAAQRGAELTRNLLMFAQIAPTNPVPVDLDQVVAGAVRLVAPAMGEQVHVEVTGSVAGRRVLANAQQMELAVVHLLMNARDALADGGTVVVHLSVGEADAGVSPTDGADGVHPGTACVRVIDSGSGMTPEVAARAFEPFFTTKSPGRSSGLGLASVQGAVTAAGGYVRLHSTPGAGTIVSLHLPVIG